MGIQKLIKIEIGPLDITLELVSSRTTWPWTIQLQIPMCRENSTCIHFILSHSLLWIGCMALWTTNWKTPKYICMEVYPPTILVSATLWVCPKIGHARIHCCKNLLCSLLSLAMNWGSIAHLSKKLNLTLLVVSNIPVYSKHLNHMFPLYPQHKFHSTQIDPSPYHPIPGTKSSHPLSLETRLATL